MLLDPRAPETRPKSAGAGAGAEMHPRVCSRAGFFQSRGFACGRVFAKPAPAPAGAIPIALRGFYWTSSLQLLIYDYLPEEICINTCMSAMKKTHFPYERTRALGFRDVRANEPGGLTLCYPGPPPNGENIRYGNRELRQSNWRGSLSTSEFGLVKLPARNSTTRLTRQRPWRV